MGAGVSICTTSILHEHVHVIEDIRRNGTLVNGRRNAEEGGSEHNNCLGVHVLL